MHWATRNAAGNVGNSSGSKALPVRLPTM